MRVLYFSSDAYSMYAGISIMSMLENNQDVEELEFFLLEDNISAENKEKIKSIFERYNKKCEFLDSNPIYQTIVKKYSYSMRDYNGGKTGWLRIFPEEIFPEYDGVVIFMDSDTIVDGSIKELCQLDWGNKALAAVYGCSIEVANFVKNFKDREEGRIIKNKGYKYFNSGIVMYNIANFKKKNYREKISDAYTKMNEFRFIDQSLLNAAFDKEDVLALDYKYNYYYFHLQPKYSHYAELMKKIKGINIMEPNWHPVIIHYPGERPWFKESVSRMAYLYREYRDMSPWKGKELSYWESPQYLKKSLSNKILE